MQFDGYRYPGTALCAIFTVVALLVTGAVAFLKGVAPFTALGLFLNLEGTVLLASAFTPTGLTPPQGGLWSRLRWFFAQDGRCPAQVQPAIVLRWTTGAVSWVASGRTQMKTCCRDKAEPTKIRASGITPLEPTAEKTRRLRPEPLCGLWQAACPNCTKPLDGFESAG